MAVDRDDQRSKRVTRERSRLSTAEISRREFLAGVAAATAVLTLDGCGGDDDDAADPESVPLPRPESSGIEHIVVVMMENRSFDHYLGWLPGADGRQEDLEFVDKHGAAQRSFRLAPNFQNCQFEDPDHSYGGGRQQFNGGASDGWLQAATDDVFPIGYYTQDDLAFFGQAAPEWTICDGYFAALLGPTFPNRLYMHAAQTDRLTNTLNISTLPTIWDRIAGRGLSGRYYFSDLPITALWGGKYAGISQAVSTFFQDAAAGDLAHLSFVEPRFVGEDEGTTNDDHPLADIRNGQSFLNQIYAALTASPAWENTVLVVNYDEWGGFFDHVPPPLAPQTALDPGLGNDGRLGFRVPCFVASPLARRGFIARKQYDHTSVLKLIEWRWGLDPLSVRDATANNIAQVLDFQRAKDLRAPQYEVPAGPFGDQCRSDNLVARSELAGLGALAVRHGLLRPGL